MIFLEEPIYISTFIVKEDGLSVASLKRSLIDRTPCEQINLLLTDSVFKLNQPDIAGTSLCFQYAKSHFKNGIPCGSSIAWSDIGSDNYEALAKNGLRLGITKKNKASPKAVSNVSRLRLFETFTDLLKSSTCENIINGKSLKHCVSYNDYKKSSPFYEIWNKIQSKFFPLWVKHDKSLDNFF